jgi:hypothetical protein
VTIRESSTGFTRFRNLPEIAGWVRRSEAFAFARDNDAMGERWSRGPSVHDVPYQPRRTGNIVGVPFGPFTPVQDVVFPHHIAVEDFLGEHDVEPFA